MEGLVGMKVTLQGKKIDHYRERKAETSGLEVYKVYQMNTNFLHFY